MIDRHAVIGSWRVSVQIPGMGDTLLNLARLSADGGVAVAFPSPTPAAPGAGHALEYWTTALGEWVATDEHNVRMIFVSLGVDETGAPAGTHTITATVTIDPELTSWSGPFHIAITNEEGEAAGEASGTVSAVRISVPGIAPD